MPVKGNMPVEGEKILLLLTPGDDCKLLALARKIENRLEPRLDERLERAYRTRYLHSDALIAKLLAAFWVAINLFFVYVDFLVLDGGPLLPQSLAVRGILLVAITAYVVRLGRSVSPAQYDRLTFLMWLVAAACILFLQAFLRPPTYINYYTVDILLIMSIYVVVPGTFWNRVIPALLYTAGHFAIFFLIKIVDQPAIVLIFVASFLIVNIIGLYFSARYYTSRRREYLGRHQDAVTRDKLAELATRDELTGALNRRGFFRRAEEEFAVRALDDSPLSLFVIDIDHFKAINDTFGHHAGDDALKTFSAHILDIIRERDSFGRTGGEEFALLLPRTDGEKAVTIAERLRGQCGRLFEQSTPPAPAFTVSIGVAQAQPGDKTVYDLYRRADKALYQAKNGGRNQVSFSAGQ
ncbi:diguanylate cyclase [Anaeroselena agilis]|uniref:GGDEF domain-containing protein n=1 Tax=Anaeroselena agilis TaxID=3063788 RepID=A0ABU3P0K1_9FIRM|nr:GGDEF domain-containing protein [Selenomonadales bacterium 4137-cl]